MQEKQEERDFSTLQEVVIDKGLCTGCGTCVGVCPSEVWEVAWVEGDAEPKPLRENCKACGICSSVCPGQEIPVWQLEEMVFGRRRDPARDVVGLYRKAFRGFAVNSEIRATGASGGAATALLAFALEKDFVEGVIVAGFNEERPYLAEGKIVTESRELLKHARSKYGGNPPVNARLSEAVLGRDLETLGLIGCPCHVHGVRKLQRLQKPKKLAESIRLVLGLFCASQMYFEGTRHLISEYCGIPSLDEVDRLDYRWGEWPGRFCIRTVGGREVLVDRHEYVYHHLLFGWQRDRCTVCLDHSAELADIAIGDFWDPQMKPGDPGWSMIIARSDFGLDFLTAAEQAGYVVIQEFDLADQRPSGEQLKKRRNPFLHKRRARYGIPVPDYGFVLAHEPGPPREVNRAPSFDGPVVVVREEE